MQILIYFFVYYLNERYIVTTYNYSIFLVHFTQFFSGQIMDSVNWQQHIQFQNETVVFIVSRFEITNTIILLLHSMIHLTKENLNMGF